MGDQDDNTEQENYFSLTYENFEPHADYSPKEIKPTTFEVNKRQ